MSAPTITEAHRKCAEEIMDFSGAATEIYWKAEHGDATPPPILIQVLAKHFPAAPQWKSIETAPRDGTLRLFCNAHFKQQWVGCFERLKGVWVDQLGFVPEPPTHWMPLPEPPKEEGR